VLRLLIIRHSLFFFRFHNAADEKVFGRNVVTPVFDDIQLSVDEYRTKLYDVSMILYIHLNMESL